MEALNASRSRHRQSNNVSRIRPKKASTTANDVERLQLRDPQLLCCRTPLPYPLAGPRGKPWSTARHGL